jgi:hypothetical protein
VRKDKNFIPSSATLLRHIQKKVAVATREKFGGQLNSLKIKEKVGCDADRKTLRCAPFTLGSGTAHLCALDQVG